MIDPVADTKVTNNPFRSDGDVSAIPNAVLATDENRLKIEEIGRASVAAKQRVNTAIVSGRASVFFQPTLLEPIPATLKTEALQQVEQQLVEQGLIDKAGRPTEEVIKKFSFERRSSLPTPGLMVKGCLDECNICEPSVEKGVDLDLERKQLENELLKKQIALLDKSQEYRCCPASIDSDQ